MTTLMELFRMAKWIDSNDEWVPMPLRQRDFILSSDFASMGTAAIAEQVLTDRYGDIYIYQQNIAERAKEQ